MRVAGLPMSTVRQATGMGRRRVRAAGIVLVAGLLAVLVDLHVGGGSSPNGSRIARDSDDVSGQILAANGGWTCAPER